MPAVVEAFGPSWYPRDVRLYGYWRSTSSWRVRLVLALKKVEYENHPVHLVRDGGQQRVDDYRRKNPMMQVPLFEWEEAGQLRRLTQSVAICEYLNERYPDPPLLPSSPYERAQVRQLVEVVNSGIQPVQNLRVLQELEAEGLNRAQWGARWIAQGFEALESLLQHTSGTFSFGDAITLADVYLVPQIYNARRFKVDLGSFPTIVRIETACSREPAFQAAHPDQQPDAVPAA